MWNLNNEERLKKWREFRLGLSESELSICLNEIAQLWATAPQSNQFMSHDEPEKWPDPWELICDNYYDDVGITLGIFYTIVSLKKVDNNKVIYRVLKGKNEIINIIDVNDGQFILNYDFGKVVSQKDINPEHKTIYTYTIEDLKRIE